MWPSASCISKFLLFLLYHEITINPLHTKGVVFISYKNENVNKGTCHAHCLQQNPTDPYIFSKYIKYTFISKREIVGYMKIMTSRAA